MRSATHLFLTLCALATAALAEKPAKPEVIAVNEEQPGLPRVLIIGDSVCQGYTPPLGELLKGKANLYCPRRSGASTVRGVEMIGLWLSGGTPARQAPSSQPPPQWD